MDDKRDDVTSVPAPTQMPSADATAMQLVAIFGQSLGELRADVRASREQGARLEAQNLQILEHGNAMANELQKLATDIVDLRSEFKRHADDPHAHGIHPPRAPVASFTNEVKAAHDSIRVVADVSRQLAEETAKQTPMIQASLEASVASTAAAAGSAVVIAKTSRDQKWTAVAIAVAAIASLLTQIFHR